MEVILYNTKSSNNTINKILSDKKLYSNVSLKDVTEITQPTLRFKSETQLNYNYCYIPDFKRYYFINRVIIFPNKIYQLELQCDVLESFKKDILNCDGEIVKQTQYNKYFNSELAIEERKEVDIYYSDVEVEPNHEIILITVGS